MNDGGPAFPTPEGVCLDQSSEHTGEIWGSRGMTLRDYFAAKVMQATVMNYGNDDHMAQAAYSIADAMLRARNQTKENP